MASDLGVNIYLILKLLNCKHSEVLEISHIVITSAIHKINKCL